ncbi:pyruvate, water dikinase [Daejeonella rubra]|uniref:Phosphoenolpyruvate synthase n=1 Tax=Daejeonella rubra TaxID=990371 RepID=A0A1G9LR53_9SPHI|nr:PEP/pyruvate-binding domain-containing protein [Daejeonella rubra]SDL64433.1 pyruvate, water dikinase [Daejeonella rubra]
MKDYVLRLKNISVSDTSEVGAKNAFLGEIFTQPVLHEIRVPDGFAVTASAYQRFIEYNKLDGVHDKLLTSLDRENLSDVAKTGQKARALILGARMPGDIDDTITAAYHELCAGSAVEVAVRSSAISSNQINSDIKDVHDSFLNVKGERELVETVKKCFASLYSEKAIIENTSNLNKSIAVCVQKMVRSDGSCSGVAYTSDPESGFADVIHISGVWGLGGKKLNEGVIPDEFIIYKPTISEGLKSIIQKKLGSKNRMMIYQEDSDIHVVNTPDDIRDQFVLIEEELLSIANWGITLENYYGSPVSMEWAKDGESEDLYLLQAKPENFKKFKKSL